MCELLMVSKRYINLLDSLSQSTQDEVNYRHFDDIVSALKEIPVREKSILILDCDDIIDFSNKSIFISPLYQDLHIIGLTSDDSLENIRNIKERNISKIILKPISNQRFDEIIRKILFNKNNLAQNSFAT